MAQVTLKDVTTEKNTFVAQSDLINMPHHNTPLTVNFNMEKAHLFHPKTGESLF